MRPPHPVCNVHHVQKHRRMEMNKIQMEKQAIRKTRMTRGARRAQAASGRDERRSFKGAADRQIAEIERTFTLRYEW
jgi:hypothetical protein